jgi:cytoskeletal protein CcmA (bactofilin family)
MPETPRRRVTDREARSPTLVGAGSTFIGNFECGGDVVLGGHIRGNGAVRGSLTVSEGGRWEGEIQALNAVIGGDVEGSLSVSEKLEIRKTARIRGSVRARTIAVAQGAVIDGDMAVTSGAPVVHFEEKRIADSG